MIYFPSKSLLFLQHLEEKSCSFLLHSLHFLNHLHNGDALAVGEGV